MIQVIREYEGGMSMQLFESEVRKIARDLKPKELAKQLLTYKELANVYKRDNDTLRQANESLMYLIAKHNVEHEWTPCSEKLPEQDGEYLVTIEFNTIYGAKRVVEVERLKNFKSPMFLRGTSWIGNVIAWQPLPKEYRGEA